MSATDTTSESLPNSLNDTDIMDAFGHRVEAIEIREQLGEISYSTIYHLRSEVAQKGPKA